MIRRSLRIGLWLGLFVGLVFAVSRLLRSRPSRTVLDLGSPGGSLGPTPEAWPPLEAPVPTPSPVQIPEPAPATPATPPAKATAAATKKTLPPWVAPKEGICPKSHPVKAKLASGIFSVEGNAMYLRTKPDRCYQTPEAAAADGLRPAKR